MTAPQPDALAQEMANGTVHRDVIEQFRADFMAREQNWDARRQFNAMCNQALRAAEDADQESSDRVCEEADGCPTELAVLQRFWRAHAGDARPVGTKQVPSHKCDCSIFRIGICDCVPTMVWVADTSGENNE